MISESFLTNLMLGLIFAAAVIVTFGVVRDHFRYRKLHGDINHITHRQLAESVRIADEADQTFSIRRMDYSDVTWSPASFKNIRILVGPIPYDWEKEEDG